MKTKFMVNAFLVLLMMFTGLHFASAQEKQLVLRVDGLACPFCAYGLEKKVMALEGVLSYDADLQKGEVYVGVKENAEIEVESLAKVVKESGFTLRKVFIKSAEGETEELDVSGGS